MRRRQAVRLICSALWTLTAVGAQATETFPARPITLAVPYAPGGATDNVARVFAEQLQQVIGQPVIIVNRPGANGRIGTQAVARAAPDGYTLLLGGIGPLTIAPHIEPVPYDPIGDFKPISILVTNDVVLLVRPTLPVSDVRSLIEYVKANPGKVNFASSGPGGPFHLAGELLNSMAGLDMTHVPYKGDGPALVDLMAGGVDVMFTTISAAGPHIASGRVKAIASAGATRSGQLPQIPTISESGLKDFSSVTWQGIFAPRGTPDVVIARLQDAAVQAMRADTVGQALAKQGNSIVASDAKSSASFIQAESKKWGEVARQAGLQSSAQPLSK